MSASAAFVRAWRVGKFTATLSMPPPRRGESLAAVIEWSPAVPSRLTPDEIREYRAGRAAAMRDLAAHFGVSVALVEV